MRWARSIFLLVFACSAVQAGDNVIYSKAFPFSGKCGLEQPHYPWNGWANVAWATPPWEASPILITNVSIDIRIVADGPIEAWEVFAGNSFTPDPMTAQR